MSQFSTYAVLTVTLPIPDANIATICMLVLYGYDESRYASFCQLRDNVIELCFTPEIFRTHPDLLEQIRANLAHVGIEWVEIIPSTKRH